VPHDREEQVNREQRRHPEKTGEENPSARPDEEQLKPDRTQDDFSVRAKNSGHKKKTADKWNQ
jgi:hypothetical protein